MMFSPFYKKFWLDRAFIELPFRTLFVYLRLWCLRGSSSQKIIWQNAYTTTETPTQTKNFVQPSISIYPTFHIIAADLICHCIGFYFVARLLVKISVFIKDIKHCFWSPFVLLLLSFDALSIADYIMMARCNIVQKIHCLFVHDD